MTSKTFIAAAMQMNSGNDMDANIRQASDLVREAAGKNAGFVALPENAFYMAANREDSFSNSAKMGEHKAVIAMQKLAEEHCIWLLIGSVAVISEVEGRLYNRSVLINPVGKITDHYDKIHLFDVDIAGDQKYLESETIAPGNEAVTAEIPFAKLGLSVCYDLRFPQLYRKLAHDGAEIIAVPAAFTYKTGEAHWHILLRARAIENTCFIIAPAQCGQHPRNRKTYGHSLIVNPWGKILAEASEDYPQIITAEIDLSELKTIRNQLPSLKHDRNF